MQLLFSDAVIVIFVTAVPKFFLFHICKRMMHGPMRMTIDLPKEVMELVYRQALIWVAAFYVPLIYPIGVLAHVAVFFVK